MISPDTHYMKRLSMEYTQPLLESRRRLLLQSIKPDLARVLLGLLFSTGQKEPPFDPSRISKIGLARIAIEVEEQDDRLRQWEHARLIPQEEGFTILHRRRGFIKDRSNIAHEIAHVLFYDSDVLPPRRLKLNHLITKAWEEEDICRYLVRELLVPTQFLRRALTTHERYREPSLDGLLELQRTFLASSDILAYKLISETGLWSAVYFKYVPEQIDEAILFHLYSGFKDNRNPRLRKVKLLKRVSSAESSPLFPTLLETKISGRIAGRIIIGGIGFESEAMALSYSGQGEKQAVMGLLRVASLADSPT